MTVLKFDSLVAKNGVEDGALILFGSPEKRCLGSARLAKLYKAEVVIILRISDEESSKRAANIEELSTLLHHCGEIKIIDTTHDDPLIGLDHLSTIVNSVKNKNVCVDISTFPKNSLLLTLRALQCCSNKTIRAIYTEAKEYKIKQQLFCKFSGIGFLGFSLGRRGISFLRFPNRR